MELQETQIQDNAPERAPEVHRTMAQIVFSQFLEHKMAVGSAILMIVFIIVALTAPLIAQWSGINPDEQNVFNRYKPPFTTIELSSDDRVAGFEHFLLADSARAQKIYDVLLANHIVQPNSSDIKEPLYDWMESSPNKKVLADLKPLSQPEIKDLRKLVLSFQSFHLLGTDELGRDVFIRLIYGTRISMSVGVMVALASALIGLLIGALAGFYGGLLDTLLMRFTDAALSIPQLPVLIVLGAADFSKIPVLRMIFGHNNDSVLKMIVILCAFSWMTVARLVRGGILSLREQEFVLAAHTLGLRDRSIILTHMVPNVLAPLLVTVTLNVGSTILYEAALSFLGLGIQPPTPSWGNMLTNAQEIMTAAPLLAIIPGVLIAVTTISFNFIGDGLQEAIDPKAVKR